MSVARSSRRSLWIQRVVTLVLSASLLGLLYGYLVDRTAQVAPRSPGPIPVYSAALPDSTWERLLGRGHLIGRPDARDTLVVFSDYECPICAATAPLLDSLLVHRPYVAVLHRHFPLSSHPYALDEAVAVECAARLGRLAAGQALLYSQRGTPVDPERVAVRLGLDPSRFAECWYGEEARAAVEDDLALARSLDLPGTPGVFYAGRSWSHFPHAEELFRLIGPSSER